MSVSEYFGKMKALADEVAATGKPLDEEDFIAYILNGLDGEFDSVVSAIGMKTEPISVMEVYSQVLNFENRLKLRQEGTASAHAASRGRGGFNPRAGGFSGGGGGGPGRGRGAPTGGANFPGGNSGGGNSRDVAILLRANEEISNVLIRGPSVKCAISAGTSLLNVGIVLMRIMYLMKDM